jgi:hypothetical protein
MTGFFVPRLLAAAAAVCVLAAVFVYPFGLHETGGLLCAAASFAWLAADTTRIVRRNREADLRVARAIRRRLREILDDHDRMAA